MTSLSDQLITDPKKTQDNVALPGITSAGAPQTETLDPVTATAAPTLANATVPAEPVSQGAATPVPETTTVDFDPTTQSVQGQINQIIAEESPLMQQAETRALQAQNQRGTLNSSMAIQAGQAALYDAALPIASQDSATLAQIASQNAAAQNQAILQGQQGGQAIDQIREQQAAESALMDQKAEIDRQMLTADADERERLLIAQGEIDRQLQELRGGQALTQIEAQGQIQSDLMAQKADIDERLLNADAATRLTLMSEQAEIDKELRAIDAQITSQLMDQQASIDEQLLYADGAVREDLLRQQGQIDSQLMAQDAEIQSRLLAERAQIDLMLLDADGALRESLLERQGQIDSQLIEDRANAEIRMMDRREQIDLALQEADGQIRKDLLQQQFELDEAMRMGLNEQEKNLELELMKEKERIDKALIGADETSRINLMKEQDTINRAMAQLDYQNSSALMAQQHNGEAVRMIEEYNQRAQLQETELAHVETMQQLQNTHSQLLQTNQNAAMMFTDIMGKIATIQIDEVMTGDQKDAAIQNLLNLMSQGLAVSEEIAQQDLGSLVDFDQFIDLFSGSTTGGGGSGDGGTEVNVNVETTTEATGGGAGGTTGGTTGTTTGSTTTTGTTTGGTTTGATGGTTGPGMGGEGEPPTNDPTNLTQPTTQPPAGYEWYQLNNGEWDLRETVSTGGTNPPQPIGGTTQQIADLTNTVTTNQDQFLQDWGHMIIGNETFEPMWNDVKAAQLAIVNDPNIPWEEKNQRIYDAASQLLADLQAMQEWLQNQG